MLKVMTDLLTIEIPLSLTAHEQAKKFSCYQSNSQKAKQVYLNTLAVMAVNNYLNYLGWKTSLTTSDSWNPLLQILMDVADLDLPDYGKLECRFALPNCDWVDIPAEVSSDRLGYLVLQFHESLRKATLLGFVTEVISNRLALTQLKSLESLPYHLSKLKESKQAEKPTLTRVTMPAVTLSTEESVSSQPIHLSRWLDKIFEIDWQPLENLPRSKEQIAYRNLKQFQKQETVLLGVSRFKILELNYARASDRSKQKVSLALILNITPGENQERDLSVKVYPVNNHTHLPEGLEILVLNKQEKTIMQAIAQDTETIEFRFSGEEGEYFKIKASLHNHAHIETFII